MIRKDTNHDLYEQRLRQFVQEVTLYPVSCEKLAAGRTDQEWLDGVLAGGARIVQLRDKESTDYDLLAKARYFREKTREAGALFLLNDRLDIALLADADGMHVGQNDLPPEEIRRLAPDFLIGLSCNSQEQAKKLGDTVAKGFCPVAYFNIGPVYSTATKQGLREFIGPQAVEQFTKVCSLPFTVMGGIKSNHIKELCAVGVKRIAVVTAISQAADIATETACWIKEIDASSRDAR
ncbi:MAG: thiamine phosphate synthase [Proteobacteria bacterium]|nr:thiamine phosphate synthase [Pseudomonadota bacterium]MBU1650523.1 thiamine phosphate synthase [Pseudomonadota bacterium]